MQGGGDAPARPKPRDLGDRGGLGAQSFPSRLQEAQPLASPNRFLGQRISRGFCQGGKGGPQRSLGACILDQLATCTSPNSLPLSPSPPNACSSACQPPPPGSLPRPAHSHLISAFQFLTQPLHYPDGLWGPDARWFDFNTQPFPPPPATGAQPPLQPPPRGPELRPGTRS